MPVGRQTIDQHIASMSWTCCCGTAIEAELDEDAVAIIREAMLMHRTCYGLTDVYEIEFSVEDDAAGLEED